MQRMPIFHDLTLYDGYWFNVFPESMLKSKQIKGTPSKAQYARALEIHKYDADNIAQAWQMPKALLFILYTIAM